MEVSTGGRGGAQGPGRRPRRKGPSPPPQTAGARPGNRVQEETRGPRTGWRRWRGFPVRPSGRRARLSSAQTSYQMSQRNNRISGLHRDRHLHPKRGPVTVQNSNLATGPPCPVGLTELVRVSSNGADNSNIYSRTSKEEGRGGKGRSEGRRCLFRRRSSTCCFFLPKSAIAYHTHKQGKRPHRDQSTGVSRSGPRRSVTVTLGLRRVGVRRLRSPRPLGVVAAKRSVLLPLTPDVHPTV